MASGRRWALMAAAIMTSAPAHVPAHRLHIAAAHRTIHTSTAAQAPPGPARHVRARVRAVTTTSAPVVSTASPAPAPQSTPTTYTPAATSSASTLPAGTPWETVARCETGGDWSMEGPVYSGGLGMLASTWAGYGGLAFAPSAGQATPAEQVTIARRVETPPPFDDTPAGGCQGW
ncbi:MAG: transglycosylase family protein [Actinomycetota bacterium]|nr:transglycosylase family protein [Actinomycetota bacterium]